MRLFFLFAPKFSEWPLAIARHLQKQSREFEVSGLVTGERAIFDRIRASDDLRMRSLAYLDDLEHDWISTPYEEDRLRQYEELLGSACLNRILVADRQVGVGFVSGADSAGTRLQRRVLDQSGEVMRRYMTGLLHYVFTTLREVEPDVVFCYAVAGAPAVALAEVAGSLGIPFMSLAPTRVGARFVIDDSPRSLLAPVRRRFEQALQDESLVAEGLPWARTYLSEFRARPQIPDYAESYRVKALRAYTWRSVAREAVRNGLGGLRDAVLGRGGELRRAPIWRERRDRVKRLARATRILERGPFETSEAVGARPFAYYPLHVDPEASTMVIAPMHTDQLAVIEALAKSLRIGMDLVVKEHTPMLGRRPPGFYDRIRSMPRVTLLGPFEEGFPLLTRAALTAVITGTAALEAMLLGRPALVIGDSPYLAIGEGLTHCPDLSRLPEVIPRAMRVAPASDERLHLYLAALYTESFELAAMALWGEVDASTIAENLPALEAISDRIRECASCSAELPSP